MNNNKRDIIIDIIKGLAILFVYLGHSILYHPISMQSLYPWCLTLGGVIQSFNMPLFFIISGYLFSKTKKGTMELYRGKTLRLLIPYLFTMAIIIGMKMVLPASMSYNDAVKGGFVSLLINALVYGGDRWFVYVLFIMYVILIPLRNLLKSHWVQLLLAIVLILTYYLIPITKLFRLDDVLYYMLFFVSGYAIRENWNQLKAMCKNYWWLTCSFFIVLNILFVIPLKEISFVFYFLLPYTGFLACLSVASLLENKQSLVVKYISYCGKYSLQFYLFTFCYPLIRWGIVVLLHVTNPWVILLSVFILQLITTTIIVEITRRINFLKIPCGY